MRKKTHIFSTCLDEAFKLYVVVRSSTILTDNISRNVFCITYFAYVLTAHYVSHFTRLLLKRRRQRRLYHELKFRVYYFRDNRQTYFTDLMHSTLAFLLGGIFNVRDWAGFI